MNLQRCTHIIILAFLTIAISACGGGSSSSSSSGTPSNNPTVPQDYFSQSIGSNAISFSVQQVPGGNVNTPYVSVQICQPGSSKCQTISNVLLDTGSTGLRIFSSNLDALQLVNQTANNSFLFVIFFLFFLTIPHTLLKWLYYNSFLWLISPVKVESLISRLR